MRNFLKNYLFLEFSEEYTSYKSFINIFIINRDYEI